MTKKMNRQAVVDYLLECETAFIQMEKDATKYAGAFSSIREIQVKGRELREIIGCTEKTFKKWIAEMEAEGEFFGRNAQGHYLFDNLQIRALFNKAGLKTIPELREEHNYRVPVFIVNVSKGGVAKSTTTLNLAVSAALDIRRSQRVLLIDTDPQGSLVKHVCANDMEYVYETYVEVIKDALTLTRQERLSQEKQSEYRAKLLDMMAQTHLENLVILPSNYDVSAIDPEISRAIAYHPEKIDGAVSVFRDAIINPLLNDFDAIFIDTAPSSNNFTAATYYASNHVNFVTTGRTQDYRSYIAHHSYLKNTINTVFPSDFDGFDSIKTVITRHINKENDKLSKKIVENVNKIKNVANVYQTFIHESRKYEEASDKHLPLALYESAQDTPYKEAIKECDALYQAVCTTVEPTLFPEGI